MGQQRLGLFDAVRLSTGDLGLSLMLEYNYPHKGYGKILDQFMLGEDILVCPVIQKGSYKRKVILPPGKWEYCDGKVYEGDIETEANAPIDVLPYFKRIEG